MLGSSCSIPRPGRACSAYLIELGETAIVADLGTGSFANLAGARALDRLDALIVSHMHSDHFLDIVPLRYALKYGDVARAERLPVYLPPGGEALARALTATFHPETDDDFLGSVMDLRTFDPGVPLRIGSATVHFAQTQHYIPTFAMRFEGGGKAIVYSADTAPDERVVRLARGAGLFVCEATLPSERERELPRGHASAREAGIMAHEAGVEHLVLSHYPASLDPVLLERDARAAFAGPISVADDGSVFESA